MREDIFSFVLVLLVALIASNSFMTVAWFAHLRHPDWPVWKAVLISWLIAAIEYAIAIPAVRAAHEQGISPATVKVAQEALALGVFAVVATFLLAHAGLNWRFAVAAALLVLAVAVVAPTR